MKWMPLFAVLLPVTVAAPSLLLPWSLIDDAVSYRRAGQIGDMILSGKWQHVASMLIEPEVGRFRPAYWVTKWLEVELLGPNPLWHHLARIALFVVVSALVYAIAWQLTGRQVPALLSAGLFSLFEPTLVNWYRLGPAESYVVLFQSASLWLLVKAYRKVNTGDGIGILLAGALVSLIPSYLTKETALALVPISFAVLVVLAERNQEASKPWRNGLRVYFVGNLILGSVLAFLLVTTVNFRPEGNNELYAGQYSSFGFHLALDSLRDYLLWLAEGYFFLPVTLVLTFATCTMRLWRSGEGIKPSYRWQIVLAVWFFVSLAIQLPWKQVEERYMLPWIMGLSIFMGIEIDRLMRKPSWFRAQPGIRCGAEILLKLQVILFFVVSAVSIWNMIQSYSAREKSLATGIQWLGTHTGRNGVVAINFPEDSEWYLAFSTYLAVFQGRNDIQVKPITIDVGSAYRKGDIVALWSVISKYSEDSIRRSLGNQLNVVKELQRGYWQIDPFAVALNIHPSFVAPKILEEHSHEWYIFQVADDIFPYVHRWEAEHGHREEVGAVIASPDSSAGGFVRSQGKSGFLLFGPSIWLPPNTYEVEFRIRCQGEISPENVVASIFVSSDRGQKRMKQLDLRSSGFSCQPTFRSFFLTFEGNGESDNEFVVFVYGFGNVDVDYVAIRPTSVRALANTERR